MKRAILLLFLLILAIPAWAQNPFFLEEPAQEDAFGLDAPSQSAQNKIDELEKKIVDLERANERLTKENQELKAELELMQEELAQRQGEVFIGVVNGYNLYLDPNSNVSARE